MTWKTRTQTLVLPLAAAVGLAPLAHLGFAQSVSNSPGDTSVVRTPEEGGEATAGPARYAPGNIGTVNPATTTSVVNAINESFQFCKVLPGRSYTIDCLAERLAAISRSISDEPGMAAASEALMEASEELSLVAWSNITTMQDPKVFRDKTSGMRTTRPVVPVSEDRIDTALAQADAILSRTETVLLRSAEGSADRATQYQRIAQAIDSNKVLLRSG